MPNAATTLATGDRVGEYEILARVGAGGMGVVYRALDHKLQRTVALKFLPEDVSGNESRKQQFLREARAASQLDHPNIGVIHGINEARDGRTFIVMAYYEGETLAARISRGSLPIPEVLDLAIQVSQGLAAAHLKAVIHRDIKPGNIIVTQQHVAKIVDFGLARATSNSVSTQTLSASGTIGYMSPEQTMGKHVDQRTDLWALGIVISEMCTGRNPFERDSPAATVFAILNESPNLPEQLPIELRGIVYHALAKDPAVRYQSANDIRADLGSLREHLQPSSADARASLPVMDQASLRESMEHASRPIWALATNQSRTKSALWTLGSIAVLAAVLLLLFLIPSVRDTIAGQFGRHEEHVAVLPFEDLGNQQANNGQVNEEITQGLVDSLTSRLSNLDVGQRSLWVVPASEVRRQKISDPAAALRALGATLAVKGSVEREGQDIHLTVNLIDTKTLRQIGSVALEDRAGDLASLQDEAVAGLARMMHINVTAAMLHDTGGSVVPAAYEDYLSALGYMRRYDKPGNLDQAVASLKQAITTDPQFALGYGALGEAFRLKHVVDPNPKWVAEASANCQRALELNSRLPGAYVTMGRLHDISGKYDLAQQEFQRALNLNPRDPDALNGMAMANEKAGRLKEAEAAFQKAIALRDDDWNSYDELGLFYDRIGKYDRAIEQLQHAAQLTPDNAQVYSNLGAVYVDMGDPKVVPQAETALEKSIQLAPSYPAYANLGMLYEQQKRYPEAASVTEKALQLNDKNYRVWENLAIAYEGLSQKDKAAAARDHELALVKAEAVVQPKDGELQSYLGLLYAQKGLNEEADHHIETALALGPDNQVILENAAEAEEHLGRRRRAIDYAQKALSKGYPMENFRTNPALASLLADPSFRPK